MRFSMLYPGEQILSFKSCLVFYAGDSLNFMIIAMICKFSTRSCRCSSYYILRGLYEPAHEIMVLIAQTNSEGSGETAHPHSLVRAFAIRTHKVWK